MTWWANVPDSTPTAPLLPVNRDRDYCGRCGAADDLEPALVAGDPIQVCGGCRDELQRRAARGGPDVQLLASDGGVRTARQRDSGTHRLSTVQASLGDLARDATRGWAIRCDLTYGTLYARTLAQGRAEILVFGSANGFIEREAVSRGQLRRRLENSTPHDPEIRHGPEEAVWPSKFLDGVSRGP